MTNLTPYRGSMHSRREDDSWFMNDLFRPFFSGEMWKDSGFRVDVKDEGEKYLLEAELPGIKKDDMQIDVEGGILTISATMNDRTREERSGYVLSERRSGSFSRSFSLENIREDEISAEYSDGILRLTLPKQPGAQIRSRRIEIQ